MQPGNGAGLLADTFWLEPPDAPMAKLVCGTVRPGALNARWDGFEDADVAGCDLETSVALARCRGEALEYLSQLPLPEQDDNLDAVELTTGERGALPAREVLRQRDSAAGISAGCAAGENWDGAVAAGFWELVERDAVARWWYDGVPGRRLAPEIEARALAYEAELRGGTETRRTRLIDISTQAGLPVVAALSAAAEGSGFVGGFAAHGELGVAAAKAIRELVQMEVGLRIAELNRDRGRTLNRNELRMLRREARLDAAAAVLCSEAEPFSHPTPDGGAAEQMRRAAGLVGQPIWVVDLTRPMFGVPVAKVVAPGLAGIPNAEDWEAGGPDTRVALY